MHLEFVKRPFRPKSKTKNLGVIFLDHRNAYKLHMCSCRSLKKNKNRATLVSRLDNSAQGYYQRVRSLTFSNTNSLLCLLCHQNLPFLYKIFRIQFLNCSIKLCAVFLHTVKLRQSHFLLTVGRPQLYFNPQPLVGQKFPQRIKQIQQYCPISLASYEHRRRKSIMTNCGYMCAHSRGDKVLIISQWKFCLCDAP